tara:strand:- start:254 stop:580 length:327 start_codon:yes stop_codon:yes gene_type:complete
MNKLQEDIKSALQDDLLTSLEDYTVGEAVEYLISDILIEAGHEGALQDILTTLTERVGNGLNSMINQVVYQYSDFWDYVLDAVADVDGREYAHNKDTAGQDTITLCMF